MARTPGAKTKDRRKAKTRGVRPSKRKLATTTKGKVLTANQWQNTPRQNEFMKNWLTPTSDTFGNAYQSAIKSGYSDDFAKIITSPTTNNKWITEYLRATNLDDEHIKQGIQDVYLNPQTYNNAKSPADTRLRALELLAKVNGLLNNNNQTTVNIVQPILGGASVQPPKKVTIDQQADQKSPQA